MMTSYVVFLRAVNVRPRWVKMDRVRAVLSAAGYSDVATYIQSGNVRLSTPARSAEEVAAHLRALLSIEFGFDIPAVVRRPADLVNVVRSFDTATPPLPGDPRRYVAFLDAEPDEATRALLDGWDAPGERALVMGAQVLLWLTVPAHSTRLNSARFERGGRISTTRDLKVVRTLAQTWVTEATSRP